MPSAAVEQYGEEPVAVVVAVASHYRRLVLLVGVLMLMGCALQASTLAGPPAVATALALVVLVAAFGVSIAMAVTVYRLMSRLEEAVPVLWAVATLLPVVSLLVLLVISQKTQAWCRRRNIYVGVLGPAKASIEWIRRG